MKRRTLSLALALAMLLSLLSTTSLAAEAVENGPPAAALETLAACDVPAPVQPTIVEGKSDAACSTAADQQLYAPQASLDAPETALPIHTQTAPREDASPSVPEALPQALYTLSYDANGGDGSIPPATQHQSGQQAMIPQKPVPQRTGFVFEGWMAPDGRLYLPGDSISLHDHLQLQASWGHLSVDKTIQKITAPCNTRNWIEALPCGNDMQLYDGTPLLDTIRRTFGCTLQFESTLPAYTSASQLQAGPAHQTVQAVTLSETSLNGQEILGAWRTGYDPDIDDVILYYTADQVLHVAGEGGVTLTGSSPAGPWTSFLGPEQASSPVSLSIRFQQCLNIPDGCHLGHFLPREVVAADLETLVGVTAVDVSSGTGGQPRENPSVIRPGSLNGFAAGSELRSMDLSHFDTSGVTDMQQMFYACWRLTALDLSGFDTSHVTNMSELFRSCTSLTSLKLGVFDTSSVTDMRQMFAGCAALTTLDLGGFDTRSVSNMNKMFMSCESLTALNISSFDTSHVTDMSEMFKNCKQLKVLDLSSFRTQETQYLRSMFYGCGVECLDLRGFDVSNVRSIDSMFQNCRNLAEVQIDSWNVQENLLSLSNLFDGCKSLTTVRLFDIGQLTALQSVNAMFQNCTSLTEVDFGGSFNSPNLKTMDRMFRGCTVLQKLTMQGRFPGLQAVRSMFENTPELTDLQLIWEETAVGNTLNTGNMFLRSGKGTASTLTLNEQGIFGAEAAQAIANAANGWTIQYTQTPLPAEEFCAVPELPVEPELPAKSELPAEPEAPALSSCSTSLVQYAVPAEPAAAQEKQPDDASATQTGHEGPNGLWSSPAAPGDLVTYQITVTYDGTNGAPVFLRDPLPVGMKPVSGSIVCGGSGPFSLEEGPCFAAVQDRWVLTAKIADLVSDSVVEITYSAQLESVPQTADGYQYWDNTVYAQKLRETTSDTIRLWYKPEETVPPVPADHLVRYVFTGDLPEDVMVPEVQRCEADEIVVLPAVRIPANFTFSGWTLADGTPAGQSFQMPEHDVTLYGHCEREKPLTQLELCCRYVGEVPANAPAIDSSWNQTLDAVGRVNLPDKLENLPDAVFQGWTPHLQIIECGAGDPVIHQVDLHLDEQQAFVGSFQQFPFRIQSPLELSQFDLTELCVDGKTFSTRLTMVGTWETTMSPIVEKQVTLHGAPAHQAKPGDVLTYTITVTNPDPAVTRTNLHLRDIHNGTGTLTAGASLPDGVVYLAEQQEFLIAALRPGQRIRFSYTYTIPSGDSGSILKNTATLLNLPTASESSTAVQILGTDFQVSKTVAPIASVSTGAQLTYTITVQNTGALPLTELNIEDHLLRVGSADTLAGRVVLVPDDSSQGVSFNADRQEFTVDHPVAVGDSVTIVCRYTVVGEDTLRTIQNRAVVSGRAENSAVITRTASADEISVSDLTPDPKPDPKPKPKPEPEPPTELNTEGHCAYITSYPDGTIRPYGTITRGEAAAIFFRLLTDSAQDKYWCQTNRYTDVPADLWCSSAISTLSNMGIIDGFSDGSFQPHGIITRAQFAKMAVGFFEATDKEYEGCFTDVAPGAWYTSYVEAAARAGLISGFADSTFRPNAPITRAQACVIVNRALDRHPDEEHLLPAHKMITWPDNNPDDWFYADMQEASNSHDYRMEIQHIHGEERKQEYWTGKLPQRDWAALEHQWSDAHVSSAGSAVSS